MKSTQRSASSPSTAVVIGGSIGGSTAAAALSDHFDRVVVVDRDELPAERKERKGAPHAYQFHALTHGGREAMEALIPGVTDAVLATGVQPHDPGKTLYCSKAGFFTIFETDMMVLLSTRINLETVLRAKARQLPGVEMLEHHTVRGLRVDDGWVTGVHLTDAEGEPVTIDAYLVVDSSGRSSNAPVWLEENGYPRPEETLVNAHWSYVTTYLRPRPGYVDSVLKGRPLYVPPLGSGDSKGATRGGGTWPQENGLWVMTAQGLGTDHPPTDIDGFREYLGSFGRPEFVDLLDNSDVVKPFVPWRNTTNRLRDYANLPSRPEGFVVIGDAVAAFNPAYGQGMSSVSIQARMLRDEISGWRGDRGDEMKGFAERYQRLIDAAIIQGCWAFSAGSDLTVSGVEVNGEPYVAEPTQEQMYTDRLLALVTEDEEIGRKLVDTIQLVSGPEWMGEPDVQAKVTEHWDRLGKLTRQDSNEVPS
ncbi:FAD-dependent oxidoreductase [Nocardia rhamnosiphila]|uniref:FAD-dependent monooxygenase n=1 Tax=Nocardia rhamnosiphila TaxID=426716 RepID=A0ABV2WYQ6_9NOCA